MTVFFDLDGTLVDSRPGILACFRHTFDRLGRAAPSEAALGGSIGKPFRAALAELLETDDAAFVERAVTIYRERYSREGLYEASVYGGVAEMLAALEGHALYVATAKTHAYAMRVLEHFDLARHFQGVFGPDMAGRPATKAELLQEALRGGAASREALMIGDRAEDMLAARSNALLPVGVLWGYGSRDELLGAGAQAVLARPDEFAVYLERSGARDRENR